MTYHSPVRTRLATVALALLVAGCRRSDPSSETLYLAMDQDVLTLDPHSHDDSVTHSVLSNVYDPLVTFDRTMRIVPALADSWQNPSDLVWQFHLRAGATFHDGRPVTAADVAYSLERARRTKVAHYLPPQSTVEVVDARTFEIHTATPEPILLNKLAVVGIVPDGTPDVLRDAVGTGAYRVVEYRKGERLEVAANDAWWGGRPSLRKAVFRTLPDPAQRARALAARQIQLARDVTARDLDASVDARHVRFLSEAGLVVVFLGVDFRNPGPLLSREVRRAIFLAIDPRELMRDSGVEGTPSDQLVPPSVFGFLPGFDPGRPRLDLARQLLRDAGYPEGLALTLEMPKNVAAKVGAELSEQLARVGIRLEVFGLDWPVLSSRLDRGESPFFSVGWACFGDASDLLDAVLHTRSGSTLGSSNFGGYSNAALDEAIERAGRTMEPTHRVEALHDAMRLCLEELPLIPLYLRKRTYGVDERVRFVPRLNGQVVLSELSWAGSPTAPGAERP